MDSVERVREHFTESLATKQQAMETISEAIAAGGRLMSDCLLNDGKILSPDCRRWP